MKYIVKLKWRCHQVSRFGDWRSTETKHDRSTKESQIMIFIESPFWSLQHHSRWKNSWTIGRKLYFELKGHQSSLMLLGILRFFVCAGFYQGNQLLNTYTITFQEKQVKQTYVHTVNGRINQTLAGSMTRLSPKFQIWLAWWSICQWTK